MCGVQTSQMLARVRPCSSRALCLLGSAQLALYDCHNTAQLLDDAKQSFLASIALEGTPATGEPRPQLTGQQLLVVTAMLTVLHCSMIDQPATLDNLSVHCHIDCFPIVLFASSPAFSSSSGNISFMCVSVIHHCYNL